jgi:hypothetical protein
VPLAIEKAQYEIDRAPRPRLPRTLRERGQSNDRAEVYTATNLAQNLSATFSAGQVQLEPLQADCRGELQARLKLHDYGYGGRMLTAGPGAMRVDGNRVEISRQLGPQWPFDKDGQASQGEITEWYVNRKEGIEQGFTLTAPPGAREVGQPLRVRMRVSGKVRLASADLGKAVELKTDNGKVWLRYDHLEATDALGRELPARVEVGKRQISLVIDDASDAAAGFDDFGFSVGISGDTVVVGA